MTVTFCDYYTKIIDVFKKLYYNLYNKAMRHSSVYTIGAADTVCAPGLFIMTLALAKNVCFFMPIKHELNGMEWN